MSKNQSSKDVGLMLLGFFAPVLILPLISREPAPFIAIGAGLFCVAWARAKDKSGYIAFLKGIGIFILTILLLAGSCLVLLGVRF